ncbi:Beta-lactamase-like protein [Fusarium oxysporum f. sp. rapae]|uniref:Beta-lactamase-like protein n=1 Tax=Fusarium oxysporum f. sp. rapae TaxID=485398 RepID=A0A8J5NK94_FUSOX|nr:Beta-lactamase-like protein [Fusarium oxysporum f. sp. rapae]
MLITKRALQGASLTWLALPLTNAWYCPPPGPVLPAAKSPSTSPHIKEAIDDLFAALKLVSETWYPNTAISVAAKSLHEETPFISHHIYPIGGLNTSGVAVIDEETVYRVSSVSKLFPVLAPLRLGVSLEDPVIKYLPELRSIRVAEAPDAITTVEWEHITIGMLASHMSGIAAEYAVDLAAFPFDLGPAFQALDEKSFPPCAVTGLNPETLPRCTRADFFRDFGVRHPVFAPGTAPVYSNIGIFLLSLVVEVVSKTPYDTFIQQNIFGPLGMTNTTTGAAPNASYGAIAVNHTSWGLDLGFENPSGGFYSNTKDLLAFGNAILEYKLLDPVMTRKWLSPVAFTDSSGVMVGYSWEIMRAKNITGDGRIIPANYKSGHLPGYQAALILVPDYDLVLTILVAGPLHEATESLLQHFGSRFIERMVPPLDQAAKDEALIRYGGVYSDPASNSTLKIELDHGPGLSLTELTVRGTSLLVDPFGKPARIRLYPSNLKTKGREAWRSITSTLTDEEIETIESGLIWEQGTCPTLGTLDRRGYGYKSLDEFIFQLDASGKVKGLNYRALDVNFEKNNGLPETQHQEPTEDLTALLRALLVKLESRQA